LPLVIICITIILYYIVVVLFTYGLVRVMCCSLVCSIGGHLWLFTAVFVQFLRWLAFLGAVIVYTYTALIGLSLLGC